MLEYQRPENQSAYSAGANAWINRTARDYNQGYFYNLGYEDARKRTMALVTAKSLEEQLKLYSGGKVCNA